MSPRYARGVPPDVRELIQSSSIDVVVANACEYRVLGLEFCTMPVCVKCGTRALPKETRTIVPGSMSTVEIGSGGGGDTSRDARPLRGLPRFRFGGASGDSDRPRRFFEAASGEGCSGCFLGRPGPLFSAASGEGGSGCFLGRPGPLFGAGFGEGDRESSPCGPCFPTGEAAGGDRAAFCGLLMTDLAPP
jgi:hypothetical protein